MPRSPQGMEHSASSPALGSPSRHGRRLATQYLLRAVEHGDLPQVRRLATQAGAELSGPSAKTALFGSDPFVLVASSTHLTLEQQNKMRKQFNELPVVVSAVGSAASSLRLRSASKESQRRMSMSSVASDVVFPTGGEYDANATSATNLSNTLSGRRRQTQAAMTMLAESVGRRTNDAVCEAAVRDPRILRAPPEAIKEKLPVLSKVFKSEDLAVSCVTRNLTLLRQQPLKFEKVVPPLNVILGGPAQAAYAVSVRSDLLEIQQPRKFHEVFQELKGCLNSITDAEFVILQTLAPRSIQVSARPFNHEALIGEYFLVRGAEVASRPVYRKPAIVMQHLGPGRAQDMYLFYDAIEGVWEFSPDKPVEKKRRGSRSRSNRSPSRSSRRPSRSPTKGSKRGSKADSAVPAFFMPQKAKVLGKSMPTLLKTPDQLAAETWTFWDAEAYAFTQDAYMKVVDSGRPRGLGLLDAPAPALRNCFDILAEALGFAWRVAEADGTPECIAKPVGNARSGDPVFRDRPETFMDLGDFTMDPAGYMYWRLQAPPPKQKVDTESGEVDAAAAAAAEAPQEARPPLALLAWEPIEVELLYCGGASDAVDDAAEVAAAEAAAAAAAAKSKGDPKAKAKGKKDDKGPAHEPEKTDTRPQHLKELEANGFYAVDMSKIRLPHLSGSLNVEAVFARCFPLGRVTIPVPLGPGGVPPLVFVRRELAAEARGGPKGATACQSVKAKKGEALFFQKGLGDSDSPTEASAVEGGAPADPDADPAASYFLNSLGELGNTPLIFLRTRVEDGIKDVSEVQMTIECEDRLKVYVLCFPASTPQTGEAGEALASESRAGDEAAPVPSWVRNERWQVLDIKAPITMAGVGGDEREERAAERLYTREIEPGRTILRGSGRQFMALVFYRRLSDSKPDPLVPLLRCYPGLPAAGDKVELLLQSLRAALGDAQARIAVNAAINPSTGTPMTEVGGGGGGKLGPWPRLCEGGSEANVTAWVFEHVVRQLSGKLGGDGNTRDILTQHPNLIDVGAPELGKRCAALKNILGSKAAAQICVRHAEVLTHDSSSYNHSFQALCSVFGEEVSRRRLAERPAFLWSGAEIELLLGQTQAAFPELAVSRLCERTSGEWCRWPDIVGKTAEEVSHWFGRISAEEKALESKSCVHAFGT